MPVAAGVAAEAAGGAAVGGEAAAAGGGAGLLGNVSKFGSQALKYHGASSIASSVTGGGSQKPGQPVEPQKPGDAVKGVSDKYSSLLQAGQFH